MLLMLLGIGLVGVFTGLVASYFVGEDEAEMASEITRLHERLDGIEDALGIAAPDARSGGQDTDDDSLRQTLRHGTRP